MNNQSLPLYVRTPLIHSTKLSEINGCSVKLKLENCQPAGSFKQRGIGALIKQAKDGGFKYIVCSSGGNAGLAAAHCANILGIKTSIVVPVQTPPSVIESLRKENAEVILHGEHWCEADVKARNLVSEKNGFYIHPFDHETIWKHHSTMVDEIYEDLKGIEPKCIVLSVGGGGLLCGVIEGLQRIGWKNVPIIAIETHGADCFNKSIISSRRVEIPQITSLAKSLGANMVCEKAMEWNKIHTIHSLVISDKEAASACIKFTNDHRILVELACGASLAAIYDSYIRKLMDEGKLSIEGDVVVIVCGGNNVTVDIMEKWKDTFGL